MSPYEPRFDKDGEPYRKPNFSADLDFGLQAEGFVMKVWESRWEVKADRYRNGRMIVETHQWAQRKTDDAGEPIWKPSGINVTSADWWVYVYGLHESFVVVSVDRLKKFILANMERLEGKQLAEHSDNPAIGFLLEPEDVMRLLYDKRWDG